MPKFEIDQPVIIKDRDNFFFGCTAYVDSVLEDHCYVIVNGVNAEIGFVVSSDKLEAV